MINTANITQSIVKANVTVDWNNNQVTVTLSPDTFIGPPMDPYLQINYISFKDIFNATKSIFDSAEEKDGRKFESFPFVMRSQNDMGVIKGWKLIIRTL